MPVENHTVAGREVACQVLSFAEYFAELWMKGWWSSSLLGQFVWRLQLLLCEEQGDGCCSQEWWGSWSPHIHLGGREPVDHKLWTRRGQMIF